MKKVQLLSDKASEARIASLHKRNYLTKKVVLPSGDVVVLKKKKKKGPSSWNLHVKNTMKSNPGLSFKAILKLASASYCK